MRRSLYTKFVIAYILLGILGFLLISTAGSKMIENQLIQEEGSDLYREASAVASSHGTLYYGNQSSIENLYASLKVLSSYQDSTIWLVGSENQLLLSTDRELDPENAPVLDDFDPAALGNSCYATGLFDSYFSEKTLSVVAPITQNMSVRGYIVIHTPMTELFVHRERILSQVYLIALLLFILSLLLLLLFTFSVYRPLKQITRGAGEYATGHLTYQIPVHSEDEMGYLATTLNYMSDALNKTGEDQRTFIANVSHDFRSPLTSIKGYLEAFLDGTIPPEMQEKYLKILLFETERLSKLTQNLLSLNTFDSKGRMLNLTDFDINEVIKNTAATFEGTCRTKRITIQLLLQGDSLSVNADMGKIQQVLYNLIDNAIKFSFHDSLITVETTERHGKVFVSVKDSGEGIAKDNLPRIWERFFKEDSSRGKDRKGTGLGLAIVKDIITAHSQNINVISTQGAGSEFIFTLDKTKK